MYVGFSDDISRYLDILKIRLEQNETMILYTDGITEAVNEKGEQFGLDRLSNVINRNKQSGAKQINYQIIKEVYNFIGDRKVYDDISLVVIKQL